MNTNDIHRLLELYYDGSTTLEQERLLRRSLATYCGNDRELMAAKAIMSYTTVAAKRRQGARALSPAPLIWRAAAVMTVALTVAATVFFGLDQSSGKYDYRTIIACNITTDPEDALSLMQEQLETVGMAAGDVNNDIQLDFALISDAFNQNSRL
ncbi:MAG: hypothetical protein NC405_09230 [Odoribacter sp.]|nr:hypothetical protein [Odoribacter sp.]